MLYTAKHLPFYCAYHLVSQLQMLLCSPAVLQEKNESCQSSLWVAGLHPDTAHITCANVHPHSLQIL